MRRKPVTKRMVEATSPMWGLSHIRTVECTECGSPFDVTSAEWAYKVRVQGVQPVSMLLVMPQEGKGAAASV
jgi:hypothetical protein